MSEGFGKCTVELAVALGNGDYFKGKNMLAEIVRRLGEARQKHSWKGYKTADAYGAICGEVSDLGDAIMLEPKYRQHDEALDVIATAIRFALREWE